MLRVLILLLAINGMSIAESDPISQLKKQNAKSTADFLGAGSDLVALDILQGKLQIPSGGEPVLFPSPYPLPYSNALPRFQLRKLLSGSTSVMAPQRATHFRRAASNLSESSQNCKVSLSPPALFPVFPNFPAESASLDCVGSAFRKSFQVDNSGMFSHQQNTLSNQEQEAYISLPDLALLSEAEKSALFSSAAATMPASISKLKPIRVVFKEFVFHNENDPSNLVQALKGIKVQVGNTLAIIPLNTPDTLPPPPSCELVLKTTGTIREGNQVTLGLRVNSVTRTALFAASELTGDEDMELPLSGLATSTIGPMTEVLQFPVTVPQLNSSETDPNNPSQLIWNTEVSVRGVDSSLDAKKCELNIPIEKTLPPICSLGAANSELSLGQSTTLTLDCNQRGSGPITSAWINGTAVTLTNKRATMSYTRTVPTGNITVNGRAVGPAGESNPNATITAGPGCLADNPDYIWMAYGGRYGAWPFRRNYLSQRGAGTINGITHEIFTSAVNDNLPCPADGYCMHYKTHVMGFRRWSYIEVGPKYSPNCYIRNARLRDIGCFAKDTRILMASGNEKQIKDLREGEWVFNPHYQAPVRVKKIVSGPEKKSLYEVRIGKNSIEVTEDHPFLTQRGWVQAMELKQGDQLMGEGYGKLVSQVTKLKYRGPQDVWNFELDSEDPLAKVVLANGIPTGELSTQLEIKKANKIVP